MNQGRAGESCHPMAAFALLALLGAPGIARAEDFIDGVTAYHHGQYETAMRVLAPLAEHGNVIAQYDVATMYYHGNGAGQDYAAAARWFLAAAESGHGAAQAELGRMYFHGNGVEQNYQTAVMWLTRAAERDNWAMAALDAP